MISQSLAPRGKHGSETFGGFIELKLPGQSDYKTLGLTCFHCVNLVRMVCAPTSSQVCGSGAKMGLNPDDDLRRELQMEPLSSMAIEDKIVSLTDEIRVKETDEQYIQV
ncbi:hypothetical protein ACN38_g2552 [Penicillium nordicum]|uniref:Uncharacterized protein n=1 Tax=Penicillium nordicum TaxID=229535 RepID=A0A0M8PEJ1_9EURO|nr:hypothetical protein ACN38_g2552 [Penicillium nordicum]